MFRDLLWGKEDYSITASASTDISLYKKLSDYDRICIVHSSNNDIQSNIVQNAWFDTTTLLNTYKVCIWPFAMRHCQIHFTDTTFRIVDQGYYPEDQGYLPRIYKIYGYRSDPWNNDIYLPNSDNDDIICSAVYTDYIDGSQVWGNGSKMIQLNGTGAIIDATNNCVDIPGRSAAYINNVSGVGKSWTVYFVMKQRYSTEGNRIFDTGGWNSQKDIIITDQSGIVYAGSWDTDTSTGISSRDFFVGAVSFEELGDPYISGNGKVILYDATNDTYAVKDIPGVYLSTNNLYFGYNPGSYSASCEMLIKYIGLVNEAESQATMEANIEHLYNEFLANS